MPVKTASRKKLPAVAKAPRAAAAREKTSAKTKTPATKIAAVAVAPRKIPDGVPAWGDRLVGVHCSTQGGVATGIDRGEALGCTAIQIFAKNNNRWTENALDPSEIEAFQAARSTARTVRCIFSHAGYLINLASGDRELTERSMESMRCEMERAEQLELAGIVVHPGAHTGDGELTGIRRIADRINILIDEQMGHSPQIWLENTAGQGTSIGHRFEHLRDILDKVREYHHIGVCLDTAHLFAAGYDLRTPKAYEAVWEEFDRVVGRRWLRAIHVNDSKKALGSRVDRHEHLGEGLIGRGAFRLLMRDERLAKIPLVCETPKGKTDAEDRANLWTLWQAR